MFNVPSSSRIMSGSIDDICFQGRANVPLFSFTFQATVILGDHPKAFLSDHWHLFDARNIGGCLRQQSYKTESTLMKLIFQGIGRSIRRIMLRIGYDLTARKNFGGINGGMVVD